MDNVDSEYRKLTVMHDPREQLELDGEQVVHQDHPVQGLRLKKQWQF